MQSYQAVFKRYEKKYMLTTDQYEQLLKALEGRFVADKYGSYNIRNIYFDTDNDELIRTSVEKPVYKEKLRLRCYGMPHGDDEVFVELKKKFDGVVYKRRISMTLNDAQHYLYADELPEKDSQILHEIEWVRQRYHLKPAACISYDREAYCGVENKQLRVTFDTNILGRDYILQLDKECFGLPILPEGIVLMEVKIPDAMPVWLSHIFSELKIFPTSFSKYGTYYKTIKGGKYCA